MNDTCCGKLSVSKIDEALEDLSNASNLLDEIISTLSVKLMPVCYQNEKETNQKEQPKIMEGSAVAIRIRQQVFVCNRHIESLKKLIASLEV